MLIELFAIASLATVLPSTSLVALPASDAVTARLAGDRSNDLALLADDDDGKGKGKDRDADDDDKGSKRKTEGKAKKDDTKKGDTKKASKDAELKAGAKFPSFSARPMSGKKIDFPSDFKGKVVLVDFWATWCGPCMSEMPNVVSVYEKYHEQGLEVIGITLDQDKADEKIKSAEERLGMKWPQIYGGGGWSTPLAKKYGIHSIPRAFLIDGSTGVIIAEGNALRGEALDAAVKSALEIAKDSSKDKSKDGAKDATKDGDSSKDKGKDKGKDDEKNDNGSKPKA
jgi:thiol-disulfide isomerase/thioredoxin